MSLLAELIDLSLIPSILRALTPVLLAALGGAICAKAGVFNVGLEGFVKDLRDCDIDVVHLDWAPSAGGDPQMAALLAKLGV